MMLYASVREILILWLDLLEKHKNLFTWKDQTVTSIISCIIFALSILAFWVPARYIACVLIILAFYVGQLFGIAKRQHRMVFMESLDSWCSQKTPLQCSILVSDQLSRLTDLGISTLQLRGWINDTYDIDLDLRTLYNCGDFRELADTVVLASSKFDKKPRRYRAWHSDLYGNFFDHVPSDLSEHEIMSFCHKERSATSLPPVTS